MAIKEYQLRGGPMRTEDDDYVLDLRIIPPTSADDLDGIEGYDDVVSVIASLPSVTDDYVRHLACMTNLRTLFLNETSVTDKGLAQLKDTELWYLSCKDCPNVTGAFLLEITQMPLRGLTADFSSFSSEALSALSEMQCLLDLEIPQKGCERIVQAVRGLRVFTLDFSFRPLSREAMEAVGTYREVRDLNLENTGIGDEGIKQLEQASFRLSLERLDLADCDLSLDGLHALAGFETLRDLDISRNPRIGDDSVEFLKWLFSPHRPQSEESKRLSDAAEHERCAQALYARRWYQRGDKDRAHLNIQSTGISERGQRALEEAGLRLDVTR